jgi:acetyl esterase/lipase
MADTTAKDEGLARIAAREVPLPEALSPQARAVLAAGYGARPAGGARGLPEPALDDTEGWLKMVAQRDAAAGQMRASVLSRLRADVEVRTIAGRPVYIGAPRGERLIDRQRIVLELHGGALVFGGGEALALDTAATALRTGRVSYSLDYRMPPRHPYPAALDDALGLYRALLARHAPSDIVIMGTSAGGNLAAALALRARDEGLPQAAGLILLTPEIDLTESGDSFNTMVGLDTVLAGRLMQMNLLYAGGADLSDPYLSPLFGDFSKGYPPTFLQTGTRDLFLSNTVRMHRALRKAGVRADLHVWDGMPHGGFGGRTPEDRELNAELQAFIASL